MSTIGKYKKGDKVLVLGPSEPLTDVQRIIYEWPARQDKLVGKQVEIRGIYTSKIEGVQKHFYMIVGVSWTFLYEEYLESLGYDETKENDNKLSTDELKKLNMDGRASCAQAGCSTRLQGCIGFLYCPDCEG